MRAARAFRIVVVLGLGMIHWHAPASLRSQEGRTHAFLVACEKYRGTSDMLSDVRYMHNNIRELKKVLLQSGMVKNEKDIWIVWDNKDELDDNFARFIPTRKNILELFMTFIQRPLPEDTIIVAFTGHGVQINNRPYYCPSDARIGQPHAEQTLIDIKWVLDQLEKNCTARRKLLIVDACQNMPVVDNKLGGVNPGAFGVKARMADPNNIISDRLNPPQSVVALFSCEAGQFSRFDDNLKHSVFFHFLLEGWSGKAPLDHNNNLTVDSLYHYTRDKTQLFVDENFSANDFQRPTIVFKGAEPLHRWVLPYRPFHEVLKGHDDFVLSVAVCEKGSQLLALSVCANGSVWLWDVQTTNPVRQLTGLRQGATQCTVAFSPDGSQALATADNEILLWNVATGEQVANIPSPGGKICCVAFTPDGKYVLAGGYDRGVYQWDLSTKSVTRRFVGHDGMVNSISVSRNGQWLASASTDRTVRLWDLRTGRLRHTLRHDNDVTSVQLSPDNQCVLSGDDQGVLSLWDLASGLPKWREQTAHSINSVAFIPSSDKCLVGLAGGEQNSMLRLWDCEEGKELTSFRGQGHTDNITSVVVCPQGRYAISGSHDKTVRIWSLPK
ncbi:MAG: caspase family protein [Gemmataceae bacterium]